MAIAFLGSSHVSVSGATSITVPNPSISVGDLWVMVFGFENVLASSGPWVKPWQTGDPSNVIGPHTNWQQACWEPPSADGGNGLEVWVAIILGVGGGPDVANFVSSHDAVCSSAGYSGIFGTDIAQGALRAAVKAQVTGNNPACPSVYAFPNELLIGCAADQLQSPGYGTPTPPGWATRDDTARAGTYGDVETVLADKTATVEGATGSIPFTATAAAGGTKGATATLAVRPAASLPVATSPLIAVEFAVSN